MYVMLLAVGQNFYCVCVSTVLVINGNSPELDSFVLSASSAPAVALYDIHDY